MDELVTGIESVMKNLEDELIRQIKSHVPVAFEIGAHILNSGGKRIRPVLTVVCARLGGYTGWDAVRLSGAIECIHTATLLHDDVVDKADTRRGLPAANTVWSNEMCVLGGDFILAKAFSTLTDLGNQTILRIVSRATEKLAEGELLQMANIGKMDLSEEDYLLVIEDKTAVLMETACRGGAILGSLDGEDQEALAAFGYNLGMAFQMTDDVIDYRSDKEVMGKNPGKDVEEGKLTLPLILALKKAEPEEKRRVESLLLSKKLAEGDLLWIREFLERRGGMAETLVKSKAYVQRAIDSLDRFPDSEEKRALIGIAHKVLHRTH
ncbi:MAG: polyprenyl synthetase family protein [Pseudomonadota bacterium]